MGEIAIAQSVTWKTKTTINHYLKYYSWLHLEHNLYTPLPDEHCVQGWMKST